MSRHTPLVAFAALVLGGCADEVADSNDGCGSCAVASGRFQIERFEVSSGSGNWFAADLDRDGRDELVVTRSSEPTRVYALDEQRELLEMTTLPAATWASFGDVTSDGRPDVLLGGTSFTVLRSTEGGGFAPLGGASVPVSGEMSGSVSVTKFPVVGRWRDAASLEPLVVKDLYHLGERSLLPTQVESFSSSERVVASGGNAQLLVLLKLHKRFVAIDMDGDGLDELWGIDLLGHLRRLTLSESAGGWRNGGTWPVADPLQLAARDANGDGSPDLVSQQSALVVTGAGASPGRVHQLELPEPASACVWLQLDGDAARELVCSPADAAGDSAELSAYDADFETDELSSRAGLGLAAGSRFVAGDFDGNGVDDLLLLGTELRIAFGVAER